MPGQGYGTTREYYRAMCTPTAFAWHRRSTCDAPHGQANIPHVLYPGSGQSTTPGPPLALVTEAGSICQPQSGDAGLHESVRPGRLLQDSGGWPQ
ncbi:hypothetical protein D3C71_1914280 [compost metagenome]